MNQSSVSLTTVIHFIDFFLASRHLEKQMLSFRQRHSLLLWTPRMRSDHRCPCRPGPWSDPRLARPSQTRGRLQIHSSAPPCWCVRHRLCQSCGTRFWYFQPTRVGLSGKLPRWTLCNLSASRHSNQPVWTSGAHRAPLTRISHRCQPYQLPAHQKKGNHRCLCPSDRTFLAFRRDLRL